MKFTIWFFKFQDNFFWQIFFRNYFNVFQVEKPYFLFGDQKELYICRKQQCHQNETLSTSGSGTFGFQKTICILHIRSKNFFNFYQNFMKLCTQIVDTQAYMLHYKRKLLAPTVFELLSFKLYEKGGCFPKIHKIKEKKFLFHLH